VSRSLPMRLALAAIAALCALAPAAASADQPRYAVSLTGSAKKVVTTSSEIIFPSGCEGSAVEYEEGFVSARLKASPSGLGAPLSDGSLDFGGTLAGLKAEQSREAKGSFTAKPGEDPAYCVLENTARETTKCKGFTDEATSKGTAPLQLTKVRGGKLGIRYASGDVAIDCNADSLGGTFLQEPVPTTLRLSRVTGLGVGGSVSASGTATLKYQVSAVKVTTKLTYDLRVTRKQ
jgi:hypothetical protein